MGGCAMRAYVRRACVPAALISAVLLTGCSSGDGSDQAAPQKSEAAKPAVDQSPEPSEAASSSAPAPVLKVGENGTFETGELDDASNYTATSKMSVTVVSAKYADQPDIYGDPKNGQYVELTLTLKNVGKAPAKFSSYGVMQWEDEKTAAQDASSLASTGEGPDLDTTYDPGQSVTGTIVLDVVRKGGKVSYVGSENPWAEGPTFVVELPKS